MTTIKCLYCNKEIDVDVESKTKLHIGNTLAETVDIQLVHLDCFLERASLLDVSDWKDLSFVTTIPKKDIN